MRYVPADHTFVIIAYKENPFLETCIQSVLQQNVLGAVKIATSTPNDHIQRLAQKYGLEVCVNHGQAGIGGDFNHAYRCADTKLVTLCHQDDFYEPEYLETALAYLNRENSPHPIIFFTEYYELREEGKCSNGKILKVKRLMNLPLRTGLGQRSRFIRRRVLSIGNSICCPSVLFNKEAVPESPFNLNYANALDWKCWADLSQQKGAFVYCPKQLMGHRIWSGSTTTENIANQARRNEDYQLYCMFWPKPIAKLLLKYYSSAESSNAE